MREYFLNLFKLRFIQKIYCFASQTGEIHIESQRLDGTNRRRIFTTKPVECNGIVYDWIGNNIFFATSLKINVISLNTVPVVKTLITAKRLIG